MNEWFTNGNLENFFLFLLIALLLSQIYILVRIRQLLRAIADNLMSISRFFSRVSGRTEPSKSVPDIPPICQFCKHRLSYIHTGNTKYDVEDFYYKCGLKNEPVTLKDSCQQFEPDDLYFE